MAKKPSAAKSTKPKFFCFVLMPFAPEFKDIYELGIKAACDSAGAYCERVDEQIFHERILDRIYNQIAKADLIIADMTDQNPNVFYEVGYAHALDQKTILLTQDAKDIPFDMKHFPHIVYGTGGDKVGKLKKELETRVRWFVENPEEEVIGIESGIELLIDDVPLESIDRLEVGVESWPELALTIRNASQSVLDPEKYYVTLLIPKNCELYSYKPPLEDLGIHFAGISEGRNTYRFQMNQRVFPRGTFAFKQIDVHSEDRSTDFDLTIRSQTEVSFRDITLRIKSTDKFRSGTHLIQKGEAQ